MPQSNNVIQYMVVFKVPHPITQEVIELIPEQRIMVEKLFSANKMLIYTLDAERTTLWAVFLADSESELINLIDRLPISQYMEYEYSELMFYQSLNLLPSLSLN